MKLPGTVPPKVQNVYETPSEIGMSFSTTSSSTMTFAGVLRLVGGGTFGGLVSTARMAAPCGAEVSPLAFGAGAAAPALPSSAASASDAPAFRNFCRDFTMGSFVWTHGKVHPQCTYRRKALGGGL